MNALQLLACFLFSLLLPISFFGQEIQRDRRPQSMKEDSNNLYHAEEITTIDVMHALEFAGIGINKYDLGSFDKRYDFFLYAEEFRDGQSVNIDTMLSISNQYHYFERGREKYKLAFIDQIKILTKTEEGQCDLRIHTYSMMAPKEISLEKSDDRQFFVWRNYADTYWKLDKKIPLAVFASSWEDKEHGFHRFCGVVHLAEGDAGTEELLTSSPNYIEISYQVREAKAAN